MRLCFRSFGGCSREDVVFSNRSGGEAELEVLFVGEYSRQTKKRLNYKQTKENPKSHVKCVLDSVCTHTLNYLIIPSKESTYSQSRGIMYNMQFYTPAERESSG